MWVWLKENDNALTILVEQKLPLFFDMFIQTGNIASEMSKRTMKTNFEDFCEGLNYGQNRLISSSQLTI